MFVVGVTLEGMLPESGDELLVALIGGVPCEGKMLEGWGGPVTLLVDGALAKGRFPDDGRPLG